MNNLTKNLLIIILLLAVIFLGVKYYQHSVDNAQEVVIPNIPTQHTDADGTVHTEIKAEQSADISFINSYYQAIIAKLSKQLKVKAAAVHDLTAVNLTTKDTFTPVLTPDTTGTAQLLDTSYNWQSIYAYPSRPAIGSLQLYGYPVQYEQKVSYEDQWLKIVGHTSKDSVWSYSITDSLTIVGYEKKTGFLKKDLYVDITSKNPHTKIVGINAFRLTPKPKTWGIGITAGYVYDGANLRPGIAVGITKTFIRW